MAWARLVRGTRSNEKAVTCRSRRTAMASRLADGGRKQSRVESTGRASGHPPAVGADTATTIVGRVEGVGSSARRSGRRRARRSPRRRKPDGSPAPRSTTTWRPAVGHFGISAGTTATRRSPRSNFANDGQGGHQPVILPSPGRRTENRACCPDQSAGPVGERGQRSRRHDVDRRRPAGPDRHLAGRLMDEGARGRSRFSPPWPGPPPPAGWWPGRR